MTIMLQQFDDLMRVRITLAGYPDGTVQVERSLNQLYWETVRGGMALPVSAGGAELDDYEWVDGVPNYYRTVSVHPPAGLLLDGAVGSYASTPDDPVLDVTGSLDIKFDATSTGWNTPAALVTKFLAATNNRSFYAEVGPSGFLRLRWTVNGLTGTQVLEECSVDHAPFAVDDRLAVRFLFNANDGGVYRVSFQVAPTIDGPWTQIDSNTGGAPSSIFAGTTPLHVGADGGGGNRFIGTVHSVEVYDGLANSGGTLVANPDFAAQPAGTTSFVDGAGRTWTVNGGAAIVGVDTGGGASITPDLGGRVWLKCLRYPFLNRPLNCLNHGDLARAARLGLFEIKGRSFPVGVSDVRAAPTFPLRVAFTTLEQVRDFDLILAAGETMLVQVPHEVVQACGRVLAVPGGYVEILNTTQHRVFEGSQTNVFELPCQVVAPPGPDVIGTTMTWGTVFALYGNWTSLIAANPTWADLLATVGSPEDLVVL